MMLTTLVATMLALPKALDRDVPVDTLDLRAISQGWGDPQKNKSVEGHPIKIGGQTFPSGVGTHAPSEFSIQLFGGAKRFTAQVGVDDETEGKGSVRFLVFVDGKKAADSGVMRAGDAPRPISADLTGAKTLRLVVGDAGDGIDYDHADWGDARIAIADDARAPRSVVVAEEPTMKIASHHVNHTELHGPRVIGCTPGHDFMYRIPAVGVGTLHFKVWGLPSGLAMDGRGVITGRLARPGRWTLHIEARSDRGTDKRDLTIVAGDHMLALTPPMGWNSWNAWAGAVDAGKIRASADAMIKTGLADYGYTYVNIDDCWQGDRDANGEIQGNAKFGDMQALTGYIHNLGLKAGVYSSPGPRTCAGFTGSYRHEVQDAKTYARWGFDYLKYDWCSYGDIAPHPDLPALQKPYLVMRNALDQADRDIVFSLCQYGMGDVWKWGKSVGGNLWRTTGDITDNWRSMSANGFSQSDPDKYVKPGGWNDPDMLVVGEVGWGNPHPTHLKPNEQITHVTLWSMIASPLIIGSDVTHLDAFTEDVLMNPEVIDVDQDPLGKAGVRVRQDGEVEVWARPLYDGSVAVALFNRGPQHAPVHVDWRDLAAMGPHAGSLKVRDLWRRQDLGRFQGGYTAEIPAHGAVLVKVGR